MDVSVIMLCNCINTKYQVCMCMLCYSSWKLCVSGATLSSTTTRPGRLRRHSFINDHKARSSQAPHFHQRPQGPVVSGATLSSTTTMSGRLRRHTFFNDHKVRSSQAPHFHQRPQGPVVSGATLSSTTTRSGRLSFYFLKIHTAITFSTNNGITLCSYYIQVSATLREQLRAIVEYVMRLFFENDLLILFS